jgi:dUTP pyrophosphatase
MSKREDWIYSLYVQHIQTQFENKNTPMKVKIKKLHADAVIPSYAKLGDAGMDLTAISMTGSDEYGNYIYSTGLAIEIPEGYVGLLFPRSSNAKTDLYLTNHVGVVDSGYRGEIMFKFRKFDVIKNFQEARLYHVGERVGQLMIIPYPQIELEEVEELSSTERGEGGYGSTGN